MSGSGWYGNNENTQSLSMPHMGYVNGNQVMSALDQIEEVWTQKCKRKQSQANNGYTNDCKDRLNDMRKLLRRQQLDSLWFVCVDDLRAFGLTDNMEWTKNQFTRLLFNSKSNTNIKNNMKQNPINTMEQSKRTSNTIIKTYPDSNKQPDKVKSNRSIIIKSTKYDLLGLPSDFMGLGAVFIHCALVLTADDVNKMFGKNEILAAMEYLRYKYGYNATFMVKNAQQYYDGHNDEKQNIFIKSGTSRHQKLQWNGDSVRKFFAQKFESSIILTTSKHTKKRNFDEFMEDNNSNNNNNESDQQTKKRKVMNGHRAIDISSDEDIQDNGSILEQIQYHNDKISFLVSQLQSKKY